jgi:hypothetical protein
MAQRTVFAQKASPSGVEEIMNDGIAVGASVGQFTVNQGDVFNLSSLFVITERVSPNITRFRVRRASNAALAAQEIYFMVSITGPTSTEYGLSEPRALPAGTYNITVEQPGTAPKALASLQVVGAGNARQ